MIIRRRRNEDKEKGMRKRMRRDEDKKERE